MCSCTDDSEMLYEEACHRWEDFLAVDQLSLVTTMNISAKKKNEDYFLINESAGAAAKICKTPFYMETHSNGGLMIIQEEKGVLYSYAPLELGSKYLNKSYYGDMNYIDSITNSYYDEEPLSDLKAKNMKITYENDTYIFKINMYQFFENYKDSEEIKDIFSSLDVDIKTFKKIWVTLSMSFSETIADMKIEMDYEYEGICFDIIMDTKIDNQKFKRIDVYNDSYYTIYDPGTIDDVENMHPGTIDDVENMHPDTIDSVEQFSSIGKVIRIPSFTTNYFKFNLEKGQYGLYATDELETETGNWLDDWALHQVRIRLFNEKKEEIPIGMGMEESHDTFTQRTFYINEPGTYYLCAQSGISADMDICLNKLNYNTIGFENIQEVPTSYKGKIEGEYDFDLFTIDGKEGEILVFENTGQTEIPMIIRNDEGITPPASKNIIVNKKMVKLNEGENKFLVCGNFRSDEEPFEYEFTTRKIVLENGYEENYEDLKKVTTDFSDLTYIAGHSLPNPRLTFDVEVKSIIDFDFEMDGISQENVRAVVLDLDGNKYYSIDENIFELKPGKYILEIDANSDFVECQVKYTATEIEDKEINVILEESSLSKINSNDFPSVIAQNVGRTQKVKCNLY